MDWRLAIREAAQCFEFANAVLIGQRQYGALLGKRLKSLVPTRGFEPRTY